MLGGVGHQHHTPALNLRLGSNACRSFQIAQTIWPALHSKGRHSDGHYDVERVNNTTEPVITGPENCISQRRVNTCHFCGRIEWKRISKYTKVL